jgi:acyl-CoA synthetase (AMP-forming)/AMP-acid ligase II
VDEAALIAHVKTQLAAYKAPRHIFVIDELYRAPNGKLDYPRAKRIAQARWSELPR